MGAADERFMRLCLRAALRGRGRVSPNPLVGAAVVRLGRLISIGWHARYGGEHAEAAALRRAGKRASGATLYVTLEPCAHHGKTPPCVDAIRSAGIARVVAAMGDPHRRVNGRGFRALRRAGIRLDRGILAGEARILNEPYLTAILRGRPLVTLKAGMTLDGRIATSRGESRFVTSAASRAAAHRLRAAHDAVLVGSGTAGHDDPRLNVRGAPAARAPLRVVLDTKLGRSPRSRLLRSPGGEVVLYSARPSARRRESLSRSGASVVAVGPGPGGVDLRRVLRDLVARGVQSLLVEGGGEVAWSFLRAGAVDRIVLYVSPRILGGKGAVPFVGGEGFRRLSDAVPVRDLTVRRLGEDLLVTGRVGAPR